MVMGLLFKEIMVSLTPLFLSSMCNCIKGKLYWSGRQSLIQNFGFVIACPVSPICKDEVEKCRDWGNGMGKKV